MDLLTIFYMIMSFCAGFNLYLAIITDDDLKAIKHLLFALVYLSFPVADKILSLNGGLL